VTEAEYEELAYPELGRLVRALDEVESDAFEAELAGDILTLEFRDGTRYVLNSHRAARQIWMAAERNAWHFDWAAPQKAWIAAKSGDELWATLERVLANKTGQAIALRA
jgi:CyaY protein